MTNAWEFAVPEGTPLIPSPGGLVRFDQEKARMRALTAFAEDEGEDIQPCETAA